MSRIPFHTRVATAAALVTAVVLPLTSSTTASAAVPAGVQQAQSPVQAADTPSTSAIKNGGYVQINWIPPFNVGKYDWVGLYKQDPGVIGLNNYVDWQWAYGNGTSYVTGVPAVSGDYWTAYISYDYSSGQYRIVSSSHDHIN
ncbi:hypothetical protein [Streptomyces sp. NBC_00158]|uniref:hypothetical protein n=1 Tax=Streptomyces sp. NBC_00158 TaxID=2903627 RepID=UPI003246E249